MWYSRRKSSALLRPVLAAPDICRCAIHEVENFCSNTSSNRHDSLKLSPCSIHQVVRDVGKGQTAFPEREAAVCDRIWKSVYEKNEKSHSYSCSSEDCCDLVARTGHQNDAIAYALDDSSVYSQDHFNIVILVVLDLARDLIDQDRAELLGFGSTGQFGIHLVCLANGVVKFGFAGCS
jgi:hypothetical protein